MAITMQPAMLMAAMSWMVVWMCLGCPLMTAVLGTESGASAQECGEGLFPRGGASMAVEGFVGCSQCSGYNVTAELMGDVIEGVQASAMMGFSVSLANDSIVATGHDDYDDPTIGVGCGLVQVFEWNGEVWVRKGQNLLGETAGSQLGVSVSLAANGLRLAAGGWGWNELRGVAYVYEWNADDTMWDLLGTGIYGSQAGAQLGLAVALSGDGSVLVVGMPLYDGGAGPDSGGVALYKYNGTDWAVSGAVLSGAEARDRLGAAVAISMDGTAVGLSAHLSDANGVDAGQAYVFEQNPSTNAWTRLGQSINGPQAGAQAGGGRGRGVALSEDASVFAVGFPEGSLNGVASGVVSVYIRASNGMWNQLGASVAGATSGDRFGRAVGLSADGRLLCVGSSSASGGGSGSGRLDVFAWNGSEWEARNRPIYGRGANDLFAGFSCSISEKLAVAGSFLADSNRKIDAGEVQVLRLTAVQEANVSCDYVRICGGLGGLDSCVEPPVSGGDGDGAGDGSSNVVGDASSNSSDDNDTNAGAIVGGVIGAIVGVFVLSIVLRKGRSGSSSGQVDGYVEDEEEVGEF